MRLHITSFILLIALAGQTFFVFILQADYMIRYEAYLERCVNREKPSLKCNGKCQLALKLRQAEKSQQDEEAPVAVKHPEPLFQQVLIPTITPPEEVEIPMVVFLADSPMLTRSLGSIFRPPCIG